MGVFQLVIAGKASRDDLQVRLAHHSVLTQLSIVLMLSGLVGCSHDDPQYIQPASGVHRSNHQEVVQRK